MIRLLIMLLCSLTFLISTTMNVEASSTVNRDDFGKYFEGYTGTFVLFDEENDQYTIFNEAQSTKQIPPCSSFKVYNSLIGLETGVITDENTVIPWDGTFYPLKSWDKDNTLSSAIANSVIWYYKELAARVGHEKMQTYINKIPYGNRDISGGATFWQTSSLKISAKEQVVLLKRLYNDELPFSERNMGIVRKIITLSNKDGIIFSGKTGTGIIKGNDVIGWFVGCVEKDGKRYPFATNIEADDNANGMKAKEISRSILKDMDLL